MSFFGCNKKVSNKDSIAVNNTDKLTKSDFPYFWELEGVEKLEDITNEDVSYYKIPTGDTLVVAKYHSLIKNGNFLTIKDAAWEVIEKSGEKRKICVLDNGNYLNLSTDTKTLDSLIPNGGENQNMNKKYSVRIVRMKE